MADLGRALGSTLNAVLEALPASAGPGELARAVGVDKVLAHRLLKAARSRDPLAVAHSAPGPEPMKRFYRAVRRRGVDVELVARAEEAVDGLHTWIREEVGDRSSFDAMISSWLPQAREEFELRRKQSAHKALSQLKGVSAATQLATVLLAPSEDGERIDVVWLVGLLGLTRWRPGARVRVATRRMVDDEGGRRPRTLSGESVEGLEGLRLDGFCHAPPAELEVSHIGESVHYLFGGDAYGKKAACDLLLAEVNRAEMAIRPEPGRRGYVFAEVSTPSRRLLFDVLVHSDVYPGVPAELEVYDTAFEGVVDANDPARSMDRLEITERLDDLGSGLDGLRTTGLPNYRELLDHVLGSMAWDPAAFRARRCEIDYPLYGSQVVVAFEPRA